MELARISNVDRKITSNFISLIFLTSYAEITRAFMESTPTKLATYENIYTIKISELNEYYNAKNELARVITSDVDALSPGIRQIYQTTSEDNLAKFDIFFSEKESEADMEKVELGLRLMEKGNDYRKTRVSQDVTFETSFKHKIAVYFPKNNDNIPEYKYSYPR